MPSPEGLESLVLLMCGIALVLMLEGWSFGLQGYSLVVGEDRWEPERQRMGHSYSLCYYLLSWLKTLK